MNSSWFREQCSPVTLLQPVLTFIIDIHRGLRSTLLSKRVFAVQNDRKSESDEKKKRNRERTQNCKLLTGPLVLSTRPLGFIAINFYRIRSVLDVDPTTVMTTVMSLLNATLDNWKQIHENCWMIIFLVVERESLKYGTDKFIYQKS